MLWHRERGLRNVGSPGMCLVNPLVKRNRPMGCMGKVFKNSGPVAIMAALKTLIDPGGIG